jgi:hypothetical protein
MTIAMIALCMILGIWFMAANGDDKNNHIFKLGIALFILAWVIALYPYFI